MSVAGTLNALYHAEPCDQADPEPGVRLLKAGEVVNRLGRVEALILANELLDAILNSMAEDSR